MIQLRDVRCTVGPRVLFDRVDWVLAPGRRAALVGPNGAGKTTLLHVLLGDRTPEGGTRVVARGTRIGHLPQEAAEVYDGTVLDRALEAHRELIGAREELDALHQRLHGISADDPELAPLLERAGELHHRLDLHDAHALEPAARRVLAGLGFAREDQDRPLAEFSGGWRMRAALAALLLSDPTLLLLDEPTNHLDLPAMEWLEDYLESFRGGLVVVSHDRVFLDRMAGEVQELDHGTLTQYAMGFTRYLEEREARRERLEARNAQVERRIAELERFVSRFGAKNTKAAQAQSKRKMIERLREERVVIPRPARGIRFQFPDPPHAGRTLVRLRDAAFAYGERPVFRHADVDIGPGDAVAIVGANGAGKTTLLRVLAGQLDPAEGEREALPHTRLAYFAQHAAEALEPDATVLETLERAAPPEWRPRLRSLLGNFLFSGDDVFKRCRVLSGGERQRLAIARILLEPANLLLLDEPTHHLDLAGKDVLEDALAHYPGAVVVVTHDRSLMAGIASRVLEVHAARVRLYPGGYEDYEASRVAAAEAAAPQPAPPAGGPARTSEARPRATAKPQRDPAHAREAKAQRETARKREREIERVERDLERREARIKELETSLADPSVYSDGAQSRELVTEYERTRAEVESLWQRLTELQQ